jgi:hypothetical protein
MIHLVDNSNKNSKIARLMEIIKLKCYLNNQLMLILRMKKYHSKLILNLWNEIKINILKIIFKFRI